MFTKNQSVIVNIPVNGEQIPVPGIATTDEFEDYRIAASGARVPSQYVMVVTYHDIPANQSKDGQSKSYYKEQKQAAFFMEPRREWNEALDPHDIPTLRGLVEESRRTLPVRGARAVPTNHIADQTTVPTNQLRPEPPTRSKSRASASA